MYEKSLILVGAKSPSVFTQMFDAIDAMAADPEMSVLWDYDDKPLKSKGSGSGLQSVINRLIDERDLHQNVMTFNGYFTSNATGDTYGPLYHFKINVGKGFLGVDYGGCVDILPVISCGSIIPTPSYELVIQGTPKLVEIVYDRLKEARTAKPVGEMLVDGVKNILGYRQNATLNF
ncbi:MAG: hypothetical protein AABW92_00095 [Nanoarchaeota archaeon]